MRVQAINGFIDKTFNESRLAGQVFECTLDRALELEKIGLVELLDKRPPKQPTAKKKSKSDTSYHTKEKEPETGK